MMRTLAATAALLAFAACASAEAPYNLDWGVQWGTAGQEIGKAIALDDSGNVFVGGDCASDFSGYWMEHSDAFVAKYSPAGELLWTSQLATSEAEQCTAVAADTLGNLYVTGWTYGMLGAAQLGGGDAFLTKFSPQGSLLWTRQFGTTSGESAMDIAIDGSGSIFLTGGTGGRMGQSSLGGADAFLTKCDAEGIVQWTQQFGTEHHEGGVSLGLDGMGNAFVCTRNVEDNAGYLAKFNPTGSMEWMQPVGEDGIDSPDDVVVDADGFAWVSGFSKTLINPGHTSGVPLLMRYGPEGELLWRRADSPVSDGMAMALTVDDSGTAYLCGAATLAEPDAFVAACDSEGNWLWSSILGAPDKEDVFMGAAMDASGNVYAAGGTGGSIFAENLNGDYGDLVVAKYRVPEPASLALLAVGGVALVSLRYRARAL